LTDHKPHIHELVPAHKVLSKDDGEKILEQYRVSRLQLPRISVKDAELVRMGANAKEGQIVGITRLDGSQYYRLVVKE